MRKLTSILFLAVLSLSPYAQEQHKRDGLVLYHNGEYAAAITVCEEEIRLDPERVDSYVVLCWALIANRQYAEAEQRSRDGLAVSPYDLRLIESYAESLYYLGRNALALEHFQRYVADAPDGSPRIAAAYYYMGEIYVRQARFQYADIALTAAVRNRPEADKWWLRLGYVREQAGNYSESLTAYEEAVNLNPSSQDAVAGRSRVFERLQRAQNRR